MNDSKWWLWSAGLIAVLMVMLGVGNLIEDDGGAIYGRILFAAVLIGGASLVAAGFAARASRPELSNKLVALGVLPGAAGIAFFWFPPAVAVGILAIMTSVAAYRELVEMPRATRAWSLAIAALAVAATAVTVGVSI